MTATDFEGDQEVEILRRRLERFDQMQLKRKMRPNISNEWVSKLNEKLKRLSNNTSNSSPPAPAQQIEKSPAQKPGNNSTSTSNNGRISQSQRLGK